MNGKTFGILQTVIGGLLLMLVAVVAYAMKDVPAQIATMEAVQAANARVLRDYITRTDKRIDRLEDRYWPQ